jgi:hypothetical protein
MRNFKYFFAVVFLSTTLSNLNAETFSLNYTVDKIMIGSCGGRCGFKSATSGILKIIHDGKNLYREIYGFSDLGNGFANDICAKARSPVEISNEDDFLIITESHPVGGCGLRYFVKKDGLGGFTQALEAGVWKNQNLERDLTPQKPGTLKALEKYVTATTLSANPIANVSSPNNNRVIGSQQPNNNQVIPEAERMTLENRIREQVRLELEAKVKEQARMDQQAKLKEQSRIMEDADRLASQKKKDDEFAKLSNELEQLKKQLSSSQNLGARKALVIGNDSYRSITRLQNAKEDAKSIAEMLAYAGWKVTLKLDLTEKEMKTALRNFKNDVNPGDETTFFYAGHGVQLGASNYLLPIDTSGDSEDQVRDDAIPLQRILDDMIEKKAKFTLALLDACRDNPFKTAGRSIGGGTRGLAATSAATGQMIVFSAGNGQQALDNLGNNDKNKNGLFTRIFLQEVRKKGQTVDLTIKNVRSEVARLAKSVGHDQVPAIYDQVLGDFYFMK